MTTKKLTTTDTATSEAPPVAPDVIGPPLPHGASPKTVTLSNHLRIDNRDYPPGSTIVISPDYARRLHMQGYLARRR
ncbi:hypothetical protein ACIQU7_23555 [Streptomyces albidoflavus]